MHRKAGNDCRLFVFKNNEFYVQKVADSIFLICEIIEYLCYSLV